MMDSEDKKIDIEGVDPRELYGPQTVSYTHLTLPTKA